MELKYDDSHETFIFPLKFFEFPIIFTKQDKGILLIDSDSQLTNIIEILTHINSKFPDKICLSPQIINKLSTQLKTKNINLAGHENFYDAFCFASVYKQILETRFEKIDESFFKIQQKFYEQKKFKKLETNFLNGEILAGKIVEIDEVQESEKLYVEQVEIGKKIQIVSGLKKYLSLDNLKNKTCLFLVNLKPAKMAGILSQGMILCCSDGEKVLPFFVECGPGTPALICGEELSVVESFKRPVFDIKKDVGKKFMEKLKVENHVLKFDGFDVLINGKKVLSELKDGPVS